jgi:hypothetical protein
MSPSSSTSSGARSLTSIIIASSSLWVITASSNWCGVLRGGGLPKSDDDAADDGE